MPSFASFSANASPTPRIAVTGRLSGGSAATEDFAALGRALLL
jgi:hypothetical protein